MKRSKVYLSRRQSRRIDEISIAEGTSGITLMENAGRACVSLLMEHEVKSVLVCCGTGNNGGDGFVIARRLAILGIPTKTIVCGDPQRIKGDALTNYQIALGLDLNIIHQDEAWPDQELEYRMKQIDNQPVNWVVDCLLGTGASGNPRPPMDRLIRIANKMEVKRMAVDVPSGLDCDKGELGDPTFNADLTCTFVARKMGFKSEQAKTCLGRVKVVTIGVPIRVLQQVLQGEEQSEE